MDLDAPLPTLFQEHWTSSTSVSSCDQDLQRRWATCSTVRMHNIIWMSMPPKMGYEQLPPNYFLRVIPTWNIILTQFPPLSDIILTFYLTFFLAYTLTFYRAPISTYFPAYILALFMASYLTFSLASGWGPAMRTEIWSPRLVSSSARWDLAIAVEVQ